MWITYHYELLQKFNGAQNSVSSLKEFTNVLLVCDFSGTVSTKQGFIYKSISAIHRIYRKTYIRPTEVPGN